MTQTALAEACGLNQSYIGGIERGHRNPTLIVIAKIAAGLAVELSELFLDMPGGTIIG